MNMNLSTLATIEGLGKFKWFSLVGEPLDKDTSSAISVKTYDRMLRNIESNSWMNLRIQALNRITNSVREHDLDLFRDWNIITKEIMPISRQITDKAIEFIDCTQADREIITKQVYWDVHHLLIEAEYSSIVEPGFFAYISYWYSVGHLPCGWQGKAPDGKLLVY